MSDELILVAALTTHIKDSQYASWKNQTHFRLLLEPPSGCNYEEQSAVSQSLCI